MRTNWAGQAVWIGQAQQCQLAIAAQGVQFTGAVGELRIAQCRERLGLGETHQIADLAPAVIGDRLIGLIAAYQQQGQKVQGVVRGFGQQFGAAPARTLVDHVAQRDCGPGALERHRHERAAERVDALLLVQLHLRLSQLLAVVLVPLLQLVELGLQLLHALHR